MKAFFRGRGELNLWLKYTPLRPGSSWIKLKPEYQKSLMDQLDLLVIGGSYGNGKGGGHITKFTLALADRSGPTNKFFTICGVANCSAADLAALTSSCGKPSKTPSRSIVCGRDKPNVWFNPESAPVVQVNAPEIIKSDSYSAGYTLRFPRIEMIRPDKDHTNCTTMEEMNEIRRGGDGKLFGNVHLIDDEVTTPRKRAKVSHRQTTLGQAFVHNDYSNERIETFNLKGKIVVVEPCLDVSLKHRCERIVVKHGGTIEQNLRKDKSGSLEKDKSTNSLPYLTSFYIQTAKLSTAKSTTIVNIGKIDVVKASWILDCENKFRNFVKNIIFCIIFFTFYFICIKNNPGTDGTDGNDGTDGTNGTDETDGTDGIDGTDGTYKMD